MADKKSAPENKTEKEVPNGDDVVGSGNDARLKMLDEINDRNDRALAAEGELKDVHEDGSTSNFAGNEENKTDEQVAAEELARAEEEANRQASSEGEEGAQAPAKHKIKVNGKEIELTTEELIERAQKVEAADEYLKEAKAKLRDTEAAKPVSKPAAPQPSNEDVAAKALERRRALVRAIQMGTEEEAMAAIDQLQAINPSINKDDVASTVDERMIFNSAVDKFQTEFKDLVEDPKLLKIVLERDKELLAQGDQRPYLERYRDIGNEVRQWRDSIVKAAKTEKPAETEKPVTDKHQRKATAPSVPQAASAKAPQAENEDEKEESTQEVIAQMAAKRGGPQWLRG